MGSIRMDAGIISRDRPAGGGQRRERSVVRRPSDGQFLHWMAWKVAAAEWKKGNEGG
ncbi:hypothetical protein KBX50_10880 [Micromonospora sp. C51]|uniref:hypothetical protein n=1 Tax=Micromonospora sp. C51 TaxID=2824879 RepID=UPI001B35F8B7|nr:hypothetical protein [Micromonospora sp. C51]MBQ1048959.1 hypothetical protein [Micromonospora sp. C51]